MRRPLLALPLLVTIVGGVLLILDSDAGGPIALVGLASSVVLTVVWSFVSKEGGGGSGGGGWFTGGPGGVGGNGGSA